MKKKIIIPLIAAAMIPGVALAEENSGKIDEQVFETFIASQMAYSNVGKYKTDAGYVSFNGELKYHNYDSFLETWIVKPDFKSDGEDILRIKDFGLNNLDDNDEIYFGRDDPYTEDIEYKKKYFKELSKESQELLMQKYNGIINEAPEKLKEIYETSKQRKEQERIRKEKEFDNKLKEFFD